MVIHQVPGTQWSMSPERFSGPPPLLVGVVPGQHPEVLQTAATLAQKLSAPLLCAYVDEASYLVEWDPARSAHRLSLHPGQGRRRHPFRDERNSSPSSAPPCRSGVARHGRLRTLAGDPARALGRLAAEVNAPMIIVGTPERGFGAPHHGAPQRLRGGLAHPPPEPPRAGGARSGCPPTRTGRSDAGGTRNRGNPAPGK